MFDISTFSRLLQTGWLARKLWYYTSVPSTNQLLHDFPGDWLTHGLVCLTDNQTSGKGQFGRVWHASPGENLTFTMVLKPVRNTGLQLFSLAVMLALKETVNDMLECECHIKWPNDLFVYDKKMAGVLTECRYNGKNLDRMLLGLGVNVNQKSFPPDVEGHAISLFHIAGGQVVDRSRFMASLLNRIEPLLDQAEYGDKDLIRNINRSIQGYGKWVSVIIDGGKNKTPVKILGINEFGFMMVLDADDEVRTFTHEEIRIELTES